MILKTTWWLNVDGWWFFLFSNFVLWHMLSSSESLFEISIYVLLLCYCRIDEKDDPSVNLFQKTIEGKSEKGLLQR